MRLARSTPLILVAFGAAAVSAPLEAAPAPQESDVVVAAPATAMVADVPPQQAGYLGVRVADVDSADVSQFKLPALRGARVESVADGSPAARAGLQKNDVILSFDGEPVRSVAELVRMVRETPPGRSVQLEVFRDGSKRQVTVVTGEREGAGRFGAFMSPNVHIRMEKILTDSARARIREQMDSARTEMEKAGREMRRSWRSGDMGPHVFMFRFGGPARLGVTLQPLSEQLGTYFGVTDGHGALISEVESGSAAEKAGLKAGDVIVKVGGKDVDGPAEVVRAIHEAKAGPLTIQVMRNRKSRTVTVDLPEKSSGSAAEPALRVMPAGPVAPAPVVMPAPAVMVAPEAVPAPLPPRPAPIVDRYI